MTERVEEAQTSLGRARTALADLHRRYVAVIEKLTEDDVNWRPNDQSNSVANLALHIRGNLRQRFYAGFGPHPDDRDRAAEFQDRSRHTPAELVQLLDEQFVLVETFVADVKADDLERSISMQGDNQTLGDTLFGAITHASEHLGQVIYIAKIRHPDFRV